MRLIGLFILSAIAACAAHENKAPETSGASDVNTENVAPAGAEETTAVRAEAPTVGRMTQEAITALGVPQDSVCRGYFPEKELRLAPCEFVGPYQGEIQGKKSAEGTDKLTDAMLACHSDINCTGVTADWYIGAKWFPVSDSPAFEIDGDSYGCSFVLSCP